MAKTALITGISGQDGAYLAELLLKENYKVFGAIRRSSGSPAARLEALNIHREIEYVEIEMLEYSNICRVIESTAPDEIYNLAAQSFVGSSFEVPEYTCEVTGIGVLRMLEATKNLCAGPSSVKFYQASSSEMFGNCASEFQNEDSPFNPQSPYAVAKVFGHHMVGNYRESYQLYAVSGILFNHESPLRGAEFVTKKIVSNLVAIYLGRSEPLVLGNLDTTRDWGFAGDYVQAMHLMLQQQTPEDYVIATGETNSVKTFIEMTLNCLEIDVVWEGSGRDIVGRSKQSGQILVRSDPKFYRPAEVYKLRGDARRARERIGWSPTYSLRDLVQLMVETEIAHPSRV